MFSLRVLCFSETYPVVFNTVDEKKMYMNINKENTSHMGMFLLEILSLDAIKHYSCVHL